jgi:transposase
VTQALQTLRGIDLIVAVTCATGLGDLSRFDNPRQLMGYLGLTPSERSTGDTVRRGGITKAGNGRVRHLLIESAWTYRHPSRIGKEKLYKIEAAPPRIREIAWKAQTRLTARYRALGAREKKRPSSALQSRGSLLASCGASRRRRNPAQASVSRMRERLGITLRLEPA